MEQIELKNVGIWDLNLVFKDLPHWIGLGPHMFLQWVFFNDTCSVIQNAVQQYQIILKTYMLVYLAEVTSALWGR